MQRITGYKGAIVGTGTARNGNPFIAHAITAITEKAVTATPYRHGEIFITHRMPENLSPGQRMTVQYAPITVISGYGVAGNGWHAGGIASDGEIRDKALEHDIYRKDRPLIAVALKPVNINDYQSADFVMLERHPVKGP